MGLGLPFRDLTHSSRYFFIVKCLHSMLIFPFQRTKENVANIKYRDLFVNFEGIMDYVCKEEKVDTDVFPVTLCINAFRGYLDEFRNSAIVKNKNSKYRKKQNRPNKREKLKKDSIVSTTEIFPPYQCMVQRYITL